MKKLLQPKIEKHTLCIMFKCTKIKGFNHCMKLKKNFGKSVRVNERHGDVTEIKEMFHFKKKKVKDHTKIKN